MANPYDAPLPTSPTQNTPTSRWCYLSAGLCGAFAAWYTYVLVMMDLAYTTLVVENDVVYHGMLLMAASYNIVLILVICAAVFGARRAFRGRWVTALFIPIIGYIAVLLVRDNVAPFLFNWYLAHAPGV